jgi:5-methylcytosine-specific restriction enzyme A
MGMTADKWHRHSRHITRGPRWRALRMAVLQRDSFRCVHCGARGRLEVDHIKPVRVAPESAHSIDNLQSLCCKCHTRKTRLECGHVPLSPERAAWRKLVRETGRHLSEQSEV